MKGVLQGGLNSERWGVALAVEMEICTVVHRILELDYLSLIIRRALGDFLW